jgi:hypothetical protein
MAGWIRGETYTRRIYTREKERDPADIYPAECDLAASLRWEKEGGGEREKGERNKARDRCNNLSRGEKEKTTKTRRRP